MIIIFESDDFITCPICGKEVKNLTKHVQMAHGLSKKEFTDMYPDSPLVAPSTSNKISSGLRNNWKDPEYAKRASSYWKSPEHSEKVSQRMKQAWADEDENGKYHKAVRDIGKKDNVRKARSDNLRNVVNKSWQDPDYVQRRRDAGRDQMLKNLNDPRYGHKRYEYNGTYFRSKWEVRFAEFCDTYGIQWFYERGRIPYKYSGIERIYVPDFYLPENDFYVEIKPKSMKNAVTDKKIEAAREQGYKIEYLSEDILFDDEALLKFIKSN